MLLLREIIQSCSVDANLFILVLVTNTDQIHMHFTTSKNGKQLMVGCFGLNGLLKQYFSLYRAMFQREGERKEKR